MSCPDEAEDNFAVIASLPKWPPSVLRRPREEESAIALSLSGDWWRRGQQWAVKERRGEGVPSIEPSVASCHYGQCVRKEKSGGQFLVPDWMERCRLLQHNAS